MTWNDYWFGDVRMTAAFCEAEMLSRQKKSEEMWLAGLYNYHAVAIAIANTIGRMGKKNARPQKYLEEPLRVIPYTEEEKKQREEQARQNEIAQFRRMMEMWERKNKKPETKEVNESGSS